MGAFRSAVKFAYRKALVVSPEAAELRLRYLRRNGLLWRPRTFNEKIEWRKFFERDPRMGPLIDKAEVKHYVTEQLSAEWVTPTLFVGPTLPPVSERSWPRPYVIKPTHRSGNIVFVGDDDHADWTSIERTCQLWQASYFNNSASEWAYSLVEPRMIVEPMLVPHGGDLIDYKLFVFGGRVEFVQVDRERHTAHKRSFFDRFWRRQPFTLNFPADPLSVPRPHSLPAMIQAAETLGRDWSFVRVDFYEIHGRPRFGEITFYPEAGLGKFDPPEYDRIFGDLWPLKYERNRAGGVT
jgi:hypothetical protein